MKILSAILKYVLSEKWILLSKKIYIPLPIKPVYLKYLLVPVSKQKKKGKNKGLSLFLKGNSGLLQEFHLFPKPFFCRIFCLALMKARMSASAWLSPVRGIDVLELGGVLVFKVGLPGVIELFFTAGYS